MNKASFLLLALLVVVSVSITACANNGENQVSEHTHEFSEWITTKSPDCGNSGSRERLV